MRNATLASIFVLSWISLALPALSTAASAANSASFVKTDTATMGNWVGAYGADGYNVSQDGSVKNPSYAQVVLSGQSNWTWAASPNGLPALQRPENPSARIAACWFSGGRFTIDVNVTDGNSHQVALYALDWDSSARAETIRVLDVSTGAVLDSRSLSTGSFHNGTYLIWNVSGHVKFEITKNAGANAVISGFFFGGAPSAATWTSAPVIFKVSDAVKSDRSFSINGEGLNVNASQDVAILLDSTGSTPATPPSNALHPTIIQTDAKGHFLVATLPVGSAAGIYNVWVKNEGGWSTPYKMNAPRALYISDYQARNGINIEVVGRNFDQAEFGGSRQMRVRLVSSGGTTYAMPIKDINPYHVTFTVGNQPTGTYFVEISNNSGTYWSRPTSGQTLTITAVTGTDPLGLGVSWAQDFKWGNVVNITSAPYNVNPADSSGNDTSAIQSAINAVETAGGGVVYLPNGKYYVSSISLGSGVVLQGQDQNNTKIYYIGTGGNMITSKSAPQLQGIARLSILLSNDNVRPDQFLTLGDGFGAFSDMSQRRATRIFVANVTLNYPYNSVGTGGRGIGLVPIVKERFLLKDCHFVGWNSAAQFGAGTYMSYLGNYFEYAISSVGNNATYGFVKKNTMVVHSIADASSPDNMSHGLFIRNDMYVADNSMSGAGRDNTYAEGETISWESFVGEGNFNSGSTVSATANTMTVSPLSTLANPVVSFSELSVWITDGRGLGQLRKVTSISGNTITVGTPFAVIPDNTSKWQLLTPNKSITAYKNTGNNNTVGILPFGNSYDIVIADNTLINTDGIAVWAIGQAGGGKVGFPSYFMRITRNIVTGIARVARANHVGVIGARQQPNYFDVITYSSEITDNDQTGNAAVAPAPCNLTTVGGCWTGIFTQPYTGGASNGTGTGDVTNTLIEGNKLSNLNTAVMLQKTGYGQVVRNNTYDNKVLQFLQDGGSSPYGKSDNTLVVGNTLSGSTP